MALTLQTRAQTPPPAAPPALDPPRLRRAIAAIYPEAALAARVEADVILRLNIDASGRVTQAQLEQGAGQGFDEAAQAACLAFEFEPARRDGSPIAARIRYRYEFRLPASAPREEPAPPTPPPPAAAPVAVEVHGERTGARLRDSAAAVHVVETAQAARHSADLGAVLAREQGLAVQRSGGLGSEALISLHGLSGDQVRLFLDGVPLEAAGFGLGIGAVPVLWVDQLAVYRGVVPLSFGADALGGAIDLMTDQATRGDSVSASYAAGAFDTHSLALRGRTHGRGWFARLGAHADSAGNDYVVRVQQADELGRTRELDARRFHDGYRALGGLIEVGVADKPWAERLSLRAFGSAFDKDLQHNLNMSVPYGAVRYGQSSVGATARYALSRIAGGPWGVRVLAGYTHRSLGFQDRSRWVYDWFGQRVFERPQGAGELSGFASDLTQWEQRWLARLQLQYAPAEGHLLRLVAAPDFAARSGRERLRVDASRLDPLTTERNILQLVTGLEYALHAFEHTLAGSLFLKHYLYRPDSQQVETFDDSRRRLSNTTQRLGAGGALRVRITPLLTGKLSYEYATRLPRPDEVFGDGALTTPNLTLTPETSHNGNLGLRLATPLRGLGQLELEATGFVRRTQDLIVRLPAGDRVHGVFQNVVDVSTLGGDGALRWRSPRDLLGLDANVTWLDMRNDSQHGAFAPYRGERMPNRPWLLANAGAQLRLPRAAAEGATLTIAWSTHYVHAFSPGWQGRSAQDAIGEVPMQLVHDLSFVYSVRGRWGIDLALDLYNLGDARAFDLFGVQKPGRAAYFKVTVCWTCERGADAATAAR